MGSELKAVEEACREASRTIKYPEPQKRLKRLGIILVFEQLERSAAVERLERFERAPTASRHCIRCATR